MPNENKAWSDYAADFPQAFATTEAGSRFLATEKGVTTIYLLGHSMGSRMTSAFIKHNADLTIAGLIVGGCRNNGKPPLSSKDNLTKVKIPVLDIWGGVNKQDHKAEKERKALTSKNYLQLEISGANHKFDQHEAELVTAVVEWLKQQY